MSSRQPRSHRTAEADKFLEEAKQHPVELPLPELLALWNVRARATGGFVSLGRDLAHAGLGCEPDLFEAESDARIRVGIGLGATASGDLNDEPLRLPSKPILVRDLPSACQEVEWITPTRTLEHAMSKMAQTGRSPLAVMTSHLAPDVSAVSWESIGLARLRKPKADLQLKDVLISPAPEVRADEELLNQVRLQDSEAPLRVHGFVFVRDGSRRICGIVTTSDLALQFRNLTNPYFQLGEIERRLRLCIDGAFSATDLHEGTGKRRLKSAHDMEFGDYVTLLQVEERWERLGWGADQLHFLGQLERARMVRNKIMHFGETLNTGEQDQLMRCLRYMRGLAPDANA
jgi:hypothetical protein